MKKYLLSLIYVVLTLVSPKAFAVEAILSADIIEGQATVKNYVKGSKSNFEKNSNGVVSYKDAAGSSPVDGTAGTALGITCARTTSSPLAGVGSLLITKTSGASRQGEGCSLDFTIDSKDKAKPMRIAFDYLSAGTYVDGDISVWIFDITNNRVIQPSGSSVLGVLISDRKVLEFQTSSDSVSYRLIWHVGVATDSANTVKIDDIEISRQPKVTGAFASDWVSYTPTGSATTNTTYSGRWRRVGDTMEVEATLSYAGATNVFSALTLSLPSGYSIDTTKLVNPTTDVYPLGIGSHADSGTAIYQAAVNYWNTGYVGIYANYLPLAPGQTFAQYITNLVPFAIGNTDTTSVKFSVPIVGWSSSQLLSSDADTRVVATVMQRTSSQTGVNPNNSSVKVNIDAAPYINKVGAANAGSNRIDIKTPGEYSVSGRITLQGANVIANSEYRAVIYKNGSEAVRGQTIFGPSGTASQLTAVGLVKAVAGDYIELYIYGAGNNSGSTLTIYGDNADQAYTSLSVNMLSGPAQIAASESVNARYENGAGTAILAGGSTLVWPTKDYDSHNGMNTVTGEYTCPTSGTYHLTVMVLTAATTVATSQGQELWVLKNNVAHGQLDVKFGTNVSQNQHSNGSISIRCLAGDVLKVNYVAGVNVNLHTNGDYNHFQIHKVGNY